MIGKLIRHVVPRDLRPAGVLPRAAALAVVLIGVVLSGGCTAPRMPHDHWTVPPTETAGTFIMPDGMALPYRQWLPEGQPKAVILALHGMNDSRDAWEYPSPPLIAAGFAIVAPDQRGFGATTTRSRWPGAPLLASDARAIVNQLRRRYPRTRLILMAESMGAATAMVMQTEPDPPLVDGYVLIAPAVWSRANMNFLMRTSLWVADHVAPAMTLTGGGFVKVTATDNHDALRRLSTDPLTIHETRVDAIKGLVDLMDTAAASASRFHAPALFLYGGHDELVPPRATAATWRSLPKTEVMAPVLAFYPSGYHLLLRDTDRDPRIGDIIAWIEHPDAPLPSGADKAASAWLARQPSDGNAMPRNPAAVP